MSEVARKFLINGTTTTGTGSITICAESEKEALAKARAEYLWLKRPEIVREIQLHTKNNG